MRLLKNIVVLAFCLLSTAMVQAQEPANCEESVCSSIQHNEIVDFPAAFIEISSSNDLLPEVPEPPCSFGSCSTSSTSTFTTTTGIVTVTITFTYFDGKLVDVSSSDKQTTISTAAR